MQLRTGRKLADIHLNYETAKPYAAKEQRDELVLDPKKLFIVEKMRFGKDGKETDKSKIQYNSHITLTGIPLEAYEYVVNGKPAIEWIMERYQFAKDKDSQIINNPNEWAAEHDDPQYILNLLKRIITVSLDTMKHLIRGTYDEKNVQIAVNRGLRLLQTNPDAMAKVLKQNPGATADQVAKIIEAGVRKEMAASEVWLNDTYQVMVYRNSQPPRDGWPAMTYLSIRRLDRKPVHRWQDLQEIKNQIVGPEHEAVELYPAESRKVDTANQYHLWVIAEPIRFPFGFNEGRQVFPANLFK